MLRFTLLLFPMVLLSASFLTASFLTASFLIPSVSHAQAVEGAEDAIDGLGEDMVEPKSVENPDATEPTDGLSPEEAATGANAAEPPPSDADEVALHDEQVLIEEEHSKSMERKKTDPYEDPAKTYLFLGLGYHHHFTPRFVTGIFTDEQTLASNPNISLEFTKRKDNFEMVISAAYQSFHVSGPFRGKGEPEGETEFIDSSLKSIMLGATFLWGTQFNDYIGIQYGFGIGIGGIFGDLLRREARRGEGDGSVNGWERCETIDPTTGTSCDDVDSDLPGQTPVKAANWINGGTVPVVWLRAAPQISLRIKPIHQLVIRIDTGFDIFSGFFVGGTMSFGF